MPGDRPRPATRTYAGSHQVRSLKPELAAAVKRSSAERNCTTFTTLLAVFSAVALALSIVGVYGVMAYAVSERTHEIGVRMALGAGPADVRGLVIGDAFRLTAAGIAAGLIGGLAATRSLRTLLFGISATDPATFILAAAALAASALAAAYIPARRASAVDPLIVLRSE